MRTDMRCDARRGLQCWQYDADEGAVPLWACMFLVLQPSGKLEFQYPDNGGDEEIEKGDWLVMVENEPDTCCVFTDEQFRRAFEVRAVPM